jgi:hypothetical protein
MRFDVKGALATCLALLAFACASDVDECPSVARACREQCVTISGFVWDEDQRCLTYIPSVLGCSNRYLDSPGPRCLRRRSNGELVVSGRANEALASGLWEACSATEAQLVNSRVCEPGPPPVSVE